ncbi:hypothetical protein JSR06_00170 [Candidatus Vidania fulgoroideae]|uniref:Uncharacterized protein n=1 Tax=Candidatus Vidania fulgoroideorum TaxID=881286 RepID=A0A974X7H7_9PROT|nr:hypothetical protein JSR06_00170 [Candidatus Vidania fulgoroideae]
MKKKKKIKVLISRDDTISTCSTKLTRIDKAIKKYNKKLRKHIEYIVIK